MKIAYFSGSIIPSLTANSIQVMKMCQAMVQNGHEPILYAVKGNDSLEGLSKDIWRHYGIRNKFDIHRMKNSPYLKGYDIAIASFLHARRKNVDMVFARNAVAAVLSSLFGYPTIYELHQVPGGRIGPSWLRLIVSGKGFVRLVAITHALKQALLSEYPGWLKNKEILVAHDAVDLERFDNLPSPEEARSKLNLPQKYTAGYSGSLYEGRGVELIMELAGVLPEVQFLIMGGDPGSVESRKEQAVARGIDNLIFFGFISNTELPQYLAACNVLLMPYQKKIEVSGGGDTSKVFSPIKLFEYMASERLIITSNLEVLCEILNENNSVLCDSANLTEWQEAIQRAYKGKMWGISLTRQSRLDVENYTWQVRVKKCLPVNLK
ncbi:MAG: glycosyltransferase [Thermodesulfobacteriota bacterium]